jgi:hypothetical protein
MIVWIAQMQNKIMVTKIYKRAERGKTGHEK